MYRVEVTRMAENEENEEQMKTWAHERNPRPHKIPVPTQYRQAAKILKQIVEEGKSFKDLVYNNKHIVSSRFLVVGAHFHVNAFSILENWKHCCVTE